MKNKPYVRNFKNEVTTVKTGTTEKQVQVKVLSNPIVSSYLNNFRSRAERRAIAKLPSYVINRQNEIQRAEENVGRIPIIKWQTVQTKFGKRRIKVID
jgi:hypothetical protein